MALQITITEKKLADELAQSASGRCTNSGKSGNCGKSNCGGECTKSRAYPARRSKEA